MKRNTNREWAVMILIIGSLAYAGHAQGIQTSSEVYHTELPEAVMEQAEEVFDEYQTPAAGVLEQNANLEIEGETIISLTFVGEGAGYKNSVGVFTYDESNEIIDQAIIFENFSGMGPGLAGGGTLLPGDTVDVGPFLPGDQVGFFVIANGFHNSSGRTYGTLSNLNPDGHDHDGAIEIDNVGTLIGFEDLWNLGDRDYNDALLMVSTSVVPQDVPEPEPEPDPGAEPEGESEQKLIDRLAQILEVSHDSAVQLIREHGFGAIVRAVGYSSGDRDRFWTALYGYSLGRVENSIAGGGGSVSAPLVCYSEYEESFQVAFHLSNPVTRMEVTTAIVTLTVVRASSNMILDVYRVPYDISAGSYFLQLDTSAMASGWYDLYLGLDDGRSHLVHTEIP
jgi:Domain of unknown function (DUF4114)